MKMLDLAPELQGSYNNILHCLMFNHKCGAFRSYFSSKDPFDEELKRS